MSQHNYDLYYLHWNYSTVPKDGSDIHRFSNLKWALTMWTVGNLWISGTSLSELKKFTHRSALPNIKYNCVVLFLDKWLVIYSCLKIYFRIYHYCKTQSEPWSPRKCQICLILLQSVCVLNDATVIFIFRIFSWYFPIKTFLLNQKNGWGLCIS